MYICFLTVRLGSKRLKNKPLKKIGKLTFIEHTILRCKKNNLTPIICTSNKKKDKIFNQFAKKYKIRIFFGSEKNKIKRWLDCAKLFNIKKFHTLDVDDPFFDTTNIMKSLNMLSSKSELRQLICPSKKSRKGGASEGYSFITDYLEKIILNKKLYIDNLNIEMIDNILKKFKKTILPNSPYETRLNFRMTLDYKKDFDLLKKIYENLGHFAHRRSINNFLNENSYLRDINYFRNKSWKDNQNKLMKNQ